MTKLAFLLILFTIDCSNLSLDKVKHTDEDLRTGAELFLESFPEQLKGKRLGLLMNPTARIGQTHMLDTLMALGHNVKALFAAEHGFRGNFGAGEKIVDGVDEATGLPVFSLYGSTRKPTPQMLSEVDAIIVDMQDVGARFYTYISTLGLVLEAAAQANVQVWVLDRPNPAGGQYVAGWLLEEEHKSFVGAYPIPVAHGMTMGELALMMVGEKWLQIDDATFIPRVIPMSGWKRDMLWPQTGLEWVPPSPNLPTWASAYVYLGTCFFEGSTLSEGRGTPQPFLTVGSPYVSLSEQDLETLQQRWKIGLEVITFTPISIPDKSPNPKYKNVQSKGVRISDQLTELNDPVAFGLDLLRTMLRNAPQDSLNEFRYRLAGTNRIDSLLQSNIDPASSWAEDVSVFKEKRKPYLIY
jgi:uncharacterized protein YbbC (DUF1343 family)